uniref:Large ribosomal subunit protein uL3m n=1 Tax=Phallusia mammillata TaxID=59560 RepID=A0A6F9DLA8_9ASCI|nr:39S ribosomal protein L3, mitochondrial-like [Phallusia mammillata]
MLASRQRLFTSTTKSSCCFCEREFHGNKKYAAKRHRTPRPKNVFTPVEPVNAVKRGERFAVRYTDKYGVRSDKFVPVHKLPAPRWSWDYDLTKDNVDFLSEIARNYSENLQTEATNAPLNDELWPVHDWQKDSKRCGAVGIKLGVHPIWFKDGSYCNSTLIQILDCNVVKYFSKEEYNNKTAALLVGAKNASPFYRNEKYAQFCRDAGIPMKAKCFRFLVTENAALKPGTPINAMHFRVGQYVDCLAKSIGYGFQGVMQRWKMAGGHPHAKLWHRRIGSLGAGGKVIKGKKMPGQLGGTYENIRGLKVLRINTKYNVIYVKGRFAGHINQFVKICDTSVGRLQPNTEEEAKRLIGPFPRYIPIDSNEELPEEIYHDSVHRMNDPSIILPSTEK